MIKAWVLYLRGDNDQYKFEELDGTRMDDTNPTSWGLTKHDEVILVVQSLMFLNAWLRGHRIPGVSS